MKEKTLRNLLYVLLIIVLTLLTGHLEQIGHEEDKASDEICRLQDTEDNTNP
uniref:hypothetical protein n=1 Tax=uncultured Dysgonomonas sp. TaxID=206096 RepID=UPI0026078782|nr:hypothetical protein [uncultured Dysgonomonas sp.]